MQTYSFRLLLFLFLLASGFTGLAQGKKPSVKQAPAKKSTGTRKDMFKIKAPKIEYVRPDTAVLVEYDEFPEDTSDAENSVYFNPSKRLSIVSEDTSTLDLGEQHIVEMSEEVLVDSTWIKVAGYYSIWDTHNINPYRKDGRNIKDTLHVKLVDPAKDRTYKMPLEKTPITS